MIKRGHKICLAILSAMFALSCLGGCNASEEGKTSWDVSSVDGSIKVCTQLEKGTLYFSVQKDGSEVVRKSVLGIETDIADFREGLSSPTVSRAQSDISYDVKTGKKSSVSTHYEELTLSFEKDETVCNVIFRAYSDGYAFRYQVISAAGNDDYLMIGEESTEFALPSSSTTYIMTTTDYTTRFCYEESYLKKSSSKLNGVIVSMPMLYKTTDGIWSLITESDVVDSDYRGSFLEGDADETLHIQPAYTQTEIAIAQNPFTSPWRVGVVGDLATIVESTLNEDVYDEVEYYKPDNYDSLSAEEQAIYDYDWVTDVKCAWTWLQLGSGTQQEWEKNKEYIKMAADKGWNWFLIDANWTPNGTEQLNAFTDMMNYAKSLGVHMMCWAHSYNDLNTEEKQKAAFAKWRAYGFEGIKVDFFDGLYDGTQSSRFGESQYTEQLYQSIYRLSAQYKLLVNIHGTCKPTGERRIYPNVIAREGVRGNEYKKKVYADDCVTIPFIRGTVGPTDFTPSLVPFSDKTTVGSQMAMHILYETGILTMGDSPENYKKYAEASAFLDELPVAYDDIKYLSGEPMKSCVLARRKGSTWYVGGMAVSAGSIDVDLSTILDADKQYKIEIFSDGATYLDIVHTSLTVRGDATVPVSVLKGGGFAISIKEI